MDHCSDRHIHNYESASQYVKCHNAAPTTPTEPHKPAAAVHTTLRRSPVHVTQEQTGLALVCKTAVSRSVLPRGLPRRHQLTVEKVVPGSGTNNAPSLTSRRYRIKGGDTCSADRVCEEPPLPSNLFSYIRIRKHATFESARTILRLPAADLLTSDSQSTNLERTQCMHHGNHGRPPR